MMFIPFPFCKIKDFVVKSITLYHFGVIKGRRKICIYAIFVNISTVILIFINIMTVFFDIFCVLDKNCRGKRRRRNSGGAGGEILHFIFQEDSFIIRGSKTEGEKWK